MSRRFDHLPDVEAFITTVEQGSFTAGAVTLATTPAVISRAIARLEARVGSQLLRRTTRSLSLTDAGRLYLEQTRTAFAAIAEAERAIQGHDGELTGRVRISVPSTFGHYRLPALLRRFAERHPKVLVEVNITNRNVDLVAEGFDLAVRFGALADSGLVARKLGDAEFRLVAAPSYLARAGMPATIKDLDHHACIHFVMPRTGRVAPWLLNDNGKLVEWRPKPRLEVSDDFVGLVSLATGGLGICQSFEFIVAGPIARGELVEVLPQLRGGARAMSVIHPPHRRLSAAARALIDALSEKG